MRIVNLRTAFCGLNRQYVVVEHHIIISFVWSPVSGSSFTGLWLHILFDNKAVPMPDAGGLITGPQV
jgi:hypothetical protein